MIDMSDRQLKDKGSSLDQGIYKDWHLGGTRHEALTTELEWAVIRFEQAFQRFCIQLGGMCGLGDLSYSELVLLHVIRMQDSPKTATILARQLNMDGITNIQYSLRKLIKLKLVTKIKGSRGSSHHELCVDLKGSRWIEMDQYGSPEEYRMIASMIADVVHSQ